MKKHHFRLISALVLSLISLVSIWGQTKPRVAVLPFSAINLSNSDAQAITSLFETALVKTGVFNVIEQNQIRAILDAQRFSLQGCTDESCAVEVGKLLAAEQIVIGELSRVGNRFILNAKIIDVKQGKNIRADNVSAGSLEEIADTGAAMLAAKLAGLTYQTGSADRIATSFGELFISTEPPGAEVFVNGISRGISPCLVEKVPVGRVVISAKKDNLYIEQPVELKEPGLLELSLTLEVVLGRVFIKSSDRNVTVYLDQKELGPLGSGLFKDLPTGERVVELKGDGVYWGGTVVIESGKTVTVEAFPAPFGTLRYRFPDGVVIEIIGSGGTRPVSGNGAINLAVGSYRIRCIGEYFKPWEERFEVTRGAVVEIAPTLVYTEAYAAELAARERRERLAIFTGNMEKADSRLDGAEAAGEDGEELVELSRKLVEAAESGHPEFLDQARELLVRSIELRISVLTEEMDEAQRSLRKKRGSTIASFAVGAAGCAVGGILYSLASGLYEDYTAVTTSAEAADLRQTISTYSVIEVLGFCTGGVGVIAGLLSLGKKIDTESYDLELGQLRAELAQLGGEK